MGQSGEGGVAWKFSRLEPHRKMVVHFKGFSIPRALPKNKIGITGLFEEKLNSLTVELLQKLSQSFKTRVEEMMKNTGEHTLLRRDLNRIKVNP